MVAGVARVMIERRVNKYGQIWAGARQRAGFPDLGARVAG
jgi:hypothetical protein